MLLALKHMRLESDYFGIEFLPRVMWPIEIPENQNRYIMDETFSFFGSNECIDQGDERRCPLKELSTMQEVENHHLV